MRADNTFKATVNMRYADDEKEFLDILFGDCDKFEPQTPCHVASFCMATNCVLCVLLSDENTLQILSSSRIVLKEHVPISDKHLVDKFIDALEDKFNEN